jgi:ribosome biogenesis SPOUT family RNA methylase Rps3
MRADADITDRTAELRKYGYAGRNLRKLQMTTDTAARVTRIVVEEKSIPTPSPVTNAARADAGYREAG